MSRAARVRSARDLGAVIAEARQLHGMTQADLAEATDIERTYLARLENGATVLLLDRVFRLCRRLGVELTATLPGEPDLSRSRRTP